MVGSADNTIQDDQRASVTRIADLVANLDWDKREEKALLDELANEIRVDGTEANPAAITINGNHFRGIANVYITMTYTDPDGKPDLVTSDTLGMTFAGEIDDNGPRLTSVHPEIEAFLK